MVEPTKRERDLLTRYRQGESVQFTLPDDFDIYSVAWAGSFHPEGYEWDSMLTERQRALYEACEEEVCDPSPAVS